MDSQTIEHLFLFRKKIYKKRVSLSPRTVERIIHYIEVDRSFFTKDELMTFVEKSTCIDYITVEEELFNGEIAIMNDYNKQIELPPLNFKEI